MHDYVFSYFEDKVISFGPIIYRTPFIRLNVPRIQWSVPNTTHGKTEMLMTVIAADIAIQAAQSPAPGFCGTRLGRTPPVAVIT